MSATGDLMVELRDGLEGVTIGPLLVAAPRGRGDTADLYLTRNDDDIYEGWVGETATLADALHFARCSPDKIRLLLDHIASLEADVARLVIAARVVAFERQDKAALLELDQASEVFADRISWDDEPSGGRS